MRLFYIEDKGCKHITDIVPGVFAVNQMEQEFFPHITVEYLPFRTDEPGGIILQTKTDVVRRNWTFKNPNDIKELRKLIWHYLEKERNIKDITVNGCLKDFKEYNQNHVTQGWKARKRLAAKDLCCKIVLDTITPEIVRHNILHEEYRLSTKDKLDKNTCKQVRFGECGDNYPPNTPLFERCVREVNWLCERGYGPDSPVKKMDEFVKNVRTKLYHELNKNNLKVNKRKFDEIIDAGLFQDLGNRMGNKVADDPNVRSSLDKIFTEKDYYLGLIEGFNNQDLEQESSFKLPFRITHGRIGGLLLLLLIIFLVYERSKKD
ncbi:hypothetical protein QKU48_gp0786 [Fadolivirus algeromassiliense]|jgi:hypothetical protein|uniref:Uncharacterized protein n=1 Tax=Fadolivirus FV1/VV64 TaxID=3070911 RepID=A0A7D3QVG2_9VIRU|nr:hypothetical protein QKU48_gp0786 [Fadolivirus algeromassiliense]QKF94244.1 hypothetical protein Fadolivirus_1_786 [Fadolivirus FV1/VV64]